MAYAIVSYIPALHKGYLDFFKKYPGELYILGSHFIKKQPRMDRDIRALAPEEIKSLITGLGIFSGVTVLDEKNIEKLLTSKLPIVMPEDEINRMFAEEYLTGKNVTFVPTFLRWDKKISTTEFEVRPDRIISSEDLDKEFIAAAFGEAEKSADWWRQIGALIVKEGKPVLTAHNRPLPSDYVLDAFGDPRSNFDAGQFEYYKTIHAEAALIAEAAKKGVSLDGANLYATTFPCPNCARLIGVTGIKTVYYAKGYSSLDAEDILRAFDVKIVMVKS